MLRRKIKINKGRRTKTLPLLVISIMAIGMITISSPICKADPQPLVENYEVDMKFNFSGPARFDNATFGAAGNATDGADPYWDAVQPPPGALTYIQAFFYYPGNPSGQQTLTTSYHNLTYSIKWPLVINVVLVGPGSKNVKATWNTTQVNTWSCYTITLETPTGDVDMRTQSNYTYSSLSGWNSFNITAKMDLHHAEIKAIDNATWNATGNKWEAMPDANVTWTGNVTIELPSVSEACHYRNLTLNITYPNDKGWGAPTTVSISGGSTPSGWNIDSTSYNSGTTDSKYYVEATISYHSTGSSSGGAVNASVTFHSVAPSDPGADGNGITFSLACQSETDTTCTGTSADSTMGDAIPEFSTLLIPVIGTIFLFFLMRRKHKK